jgi:hypothetical protein
MAFLLLLLPLPLFSSLFIHSVSYNYISSPQTFSNIRKNVFIYGTHALDLQISLLESIGCEFQKRNLSLKFRILRFLFPLIQGETLTNNNDPKKQFLNS